MLLAPLLSPKRWFSALGMATLVAPVSNKKVTASSEESNKGNLSKNATDGNPATRWCAANGASGSWLQVDLGQKQDIQNIRIILWPV